MIYSSTTSLTDPNNLWYAVQAYCESTESSFVAQIPEFVQAAELRIYNTVQLPATFKTASISFTALTPTITLPSGWLATNSISYVDPITNETYYLLNKDFNFLKESFPSATASGTPQYYAIYTQSPTVAQIYLAPTPNTSASGQITYFGYPDSIVTAGTSWLGNNFEHVLLYGTLREAYTYLKGEADTMAMYEEKYKEALAQLKNLGEARDRQDSYRSGQLRTPVA